MPHAQVVAWIIVVSFGLNQPLDHLHEVSLGLVIIVLDLFLLVVRILLKLPLTEQLEQNGLIGRLEVSKADDLGNLEAVSRCTVNVKQRWDRALTHLDVSGS